MRCADDARDGNDGPWSSFTVQIGTPSQDIRVLPSTSGSSIWAVVAEGCNITTDPSECAINRGQLFYPNESSTWSEKGTYQLQIPAESSLGYSGNAYFGFDTVSLGYQGSGGPTISHLVVGGIVTKDFFVGTLGLTPNAINFTDFNTPKPSLLAHLRNQKRIAGRSYAYTAGAQYTPKPTFGSLTFGGRDTTRFVPNNLTINRAADITRDLLVGIQAINSEGGSLLSEGIIAFVDSTASQIWLPIETCQRLLEPYKR